MRVRTLTALEQMNVLGIDIEIYFLLDGLLSTLAQGRALRSCRCSLEVGREEGQLAALRLGDPGLCAGRMVVENGLSAEECLGGLLEVLLEGFKVCERRRRPNRGGCHLWVFVCFVEITYKLQWYRREA